MIGKISPVVNKKYPTRLVLKIAKISSAAWYRKKRLKNKKLKPGRKPAVSDEKLLSEINAEIADPVFHSEGYKQVHARIRNRNIMCGKNRIYNLMLKNNLLVAHRIINNGSSRSHNGTIITDLPNKMWGTDGKYFQGCIIYL